MTVLQKIAQVLQQSGRNGDTMLAHITPGEAKLLKALGGSGQKNPNTGLPEFQIDFSKLDAAATGGDSSPVTFLDAAGRTRDVNLPISWILPDAVTDPIGLHPDMTDIQRRADLATFALQGNPLYRTPEAFNFYQSVLGRNLISPEGIIDTAQQILPIERQFAQEVLGVQTPSESVEDFAEALGLGVRTAPTSRADPASSLARRRPTSGIPAPVRTIRAPTMEAALIQHGGNQILRAMRANELVLGEGGGQ